MTELAYARGDDRLPMLHEPIDPEPLLARWRNADVDSRGVGELTCAVRDGQLYVRVTGVGPQGPIDWGEVPAALFSDVSITGGGRAAAPPVLDGRATPNFAEVSATDCGPAFTAFYDHGFMRVNVQGRINLGLLAVSFFTEFTDDSGRSSYFTREVFVR